MDKYASIQSSAFFSEFEKIMEKEAASPVGFIGRAGKYLTRTPEAMAQTGRVGGALLGAGIGAGTGALKAPPEDRARAALVGGLVGAGLGLGVGQLATRAGRGQVQRLGQIQLHGITGYLPGHGITGRGISKLPEAQRAQARLQAAQKMRLTGSGWRAAEAKRLQEAGGAENIARAKKLLEWAAPATLGEAREIAAREIGEGFFTKRLAAASPELREKLIAAKARLLHAPREAVETGATSIPGIVRGAVLGPAGGQGRGAVLRSAALGGGGLGLGLGTVAGLSSAPAAIAGTGAYEGVSPARRLGRWAGETAGWTFGSAMPVMGGMTLGTVGGKAGEILGRGAETAGRGAVGFVRRGVGYQG
jgi:hypothetical protein